MDEHSDLAVRLRKANEFAVSLLGLNQDEAKEAAVRGGYLRSEVITPDIHAVTADLDPFRIRLFVDEAGVVIRATGG